MMLRALAVLAIAAVQHVASDGVVQLSEAFGGPHGGGFTDEASIVGGETVSAVTIRAGARIDGVSIDISGPTPQTFTHGFDGVSDANSAIHLGPGEFITSMEIHTAKNRHTNQRTRVFYLKFDTNLGNSVSAGSPTDNKNTVTAPPGYQLVGFHGRNDPGRIDQLGAIWTTIPATPAPATPPPAPETVAPTAILPQSASSSAAGSTAAGPDVIIVSESPSTSPPAPAPSGPATQLSDVFGGPHGSEFSDQPLATSAQTVTSIVIRSGSRVDGIALEVTAPTAQRFVHGYDGVSNSNNMLSLAAGEYITSMEVHWDKNRHTKQHTRVFYLKFGTSTGRFVEGGTPTKYSATATAPEGYQLGGFFGRGEQDIYRLGAVWTSIAAVADPPAPTGPDEGEDMQLSPLYGGPHGVAFSDIESVKFTQSASSITICAGARIDGLTLQIQTPTEQTWSHGYSCAEGSTLTLGPVEFIKSMEVHWGKNKHTNDRTRVFYLEFTTNEGRTVSGGSKAKDNTVVTAPVGFRLAGFYGRAEAGDTVHQIGVIWTRIAARDLSLTDPMESSGSGVSYTTTIRNWVGPTIGTSTDTACYRKSVGFGANKVCPLGYSNDGDDCTTECPLAYPVECFLECLPQNDDCALAVMHKIGSVVAVALNAATGGVFGSMYSAYKTVSRTLTCIAGIVNVVRGLIFYLRYRQTTAPQGTTAELLTIAYQADVVVFDLPMAVCTCMGLPIPKNAQFADTVLVVVEGIVKQAITNGEEIISTADNALNLLTGAGALNNTPDATVDELQSFISKNSSCGYELKRLTDHVVRAVNDVRNSTPDASANDQRNIHARPSALPDPQTTRLISNRPRQRLQVFDRDERHPKRDEHVHGRGVRQQEVDSCV